MSDLDAFRLYLAIRFAFEYGYNIGKYKGGSKKWDANIMKRGDLHLIRFILKYVDTPRELARFCVGNFLYGNNQFLYDETFSTANYNSHMSYMRSKHKKLVEDIDILEIRHYNHGSIKNYLNSDAACEDIYSSKIRMESFVILHQIFDWFLPKVGYQSETIINRIKRATPFILIDDDTKTIVSRTWLSSISE